MNEKCFISVKDTLQDLINDFPDKDKVKTFFESKGFNFMCWIIFEKATYDWNPNIRLWKQFNDFKEKGDWVIAYHKDTYKREDNVWRIQIAYTLLDSRGYGSIHSLYRSVSLLLKTMYRELNTGTLPYKD